MARRIVKATGRLDIHHDQIRILLSGPTGETSADIRRRARAVQRRAQSAAPVDTGTLRSSIRVNTTYPSTGAVADIIADAPYAAFVEFGRKEVEPKKQYLTWEKAGSEDGVFAKSAAAVPATHFLSKALDVVDD